MSQATPRMRMFAGPNGSGKSTIKDDFPQDLLGLYINADDIEKQIRQQRYFDLTVFHLEVSADEILPFFIHPLS